MTSQTAGVKAWQHGYAMDHLLAIEALYADYNRQSVSPFSAVKKHTVAQLLHEQRLRVVYDTARTPVAAFSVARAKVASPITIYNDVELARKAPGDVTLAHITGDLDRISQLLTDYRGDNTWAITWSRDRLVHGMLTSAGFRRMGSKVTTFGEILFIFFRDSERAYAPGHLFGPPGEKGTCGLSPAEFVGIKRIGHVGSASEVITQTPRKIAELAVTFTNHYSNYNKDKSWSAVALRGFSSDPAFIAKPSEMSKKWHDEHQHDVYALQDTPLRPLFPEVDAAIAPYGDTFERIRFMQLAPGGGELDRHTDQVDNDTGVRVGNNARIHIPLITNDKVEFTSWDLDDQPHIVNMRVGEVWYLDTRKPHRAINAGETARIHLVVDVIVTPRFIDLLERS